MGRFAEQLHAAFAQVILVGTGLVGVGEHREHEVGSVRADRGVGETEGRPGVLGADPEEALDSALGRSGGRVQPGDLFGCGVGPAFRSPSSRSTSSTWAGITLAKGTSSLWMAALLAGLRAARSGAAEPVTAPDAD